MSVGESQAEYEARRMMINDPQATLDLLEALSSAIANWGAAMLDDPEWLKARVKSLEALISESNPVIWATTQDAVAASEWAHKAHELGVWPRGVSTED
jgi:hypothetical protein